MKYNIMCAHCHTEYEVDVDFEPVCCMKCGSREAKVIPVKSKSRITAEEYMTRMDEIKPRMVKAWKEYYEIRLEYEDILTCYAVYRRRGVITEEELRKYQYKQQMPNGKNFNADLKEYRRRKKEG